MPTPYYLWTKTDSSLPENSSIVTNEDCSSTLTIFSVMLEDYGEYNCIAVSGDNVQVSALLIGRSFTGYKDMIVMNLFSLYFFVNNVSYPRQCIMIETIKLC